jgi:hypothetical protein
VITSRELVERLVRAGPDHARGAGDLFGRCVGAVLDRAGVGGQQRQPVGEHVVHLAGDPGALGRPRLGDPAALLRLGAARPLLQRGDEGVAGPGHLAPADQGRLRHDHQDQPPDVRQPADGPPQALHRPGHNPGRAHRGGHREAAPLGDVQGAGRRRRDGGG